MGEKRCRVIMVAHEVLLKASRVPCRGGIHRIQKAGRDPLGSPRVKGEVSASTGLTPRWLCKRKGNHPFPPVLFFSPRLVQELRCPRQKVWLREGWCWLKRIVLLTSPCTSLGRSGSHKTHPVCFLVFCEPGRRAGGRRAQAVALVLLCLEQSSRCPALQPRQPGLTCTHPDDAQHLCGASHKVTGSVCPQCTKSPARGWPAAISEMFSISTPAPPLGTGREHLKMSQSVLAAAREKNSAEGVVGGKTIHYSRSISATAGLTPRDRQKALFSLSLPAIHQFYCSTKPPL